MNLKDVDLNLLVALDALLRERNVTRAGRVIGLSQPAMSATLGRLRNLFGDPLLERVGREYRLTACARELIEPLRTALSAVERTLQRNAPFDPTTAKRRFRIATSDHLLIILCPQLVDHVRKAAPGIQLHLQQVTPDIARDLTARRIDLSLQPSGVLTGFASEDLFADRWICAVWKGNHAVKKRLSKEQLYSLPHASFRAGRNSLTEILLTPQLNEPVPVRASTTSFIALAWLLRGTPMVALMQSLLCSQLEEAAEIRAVEPPVPIRKLVMAMAWNPVFTPDPAHAWLRATVREVAQRHCVVPGLTLDRWTSADAKKANP